jgi:prevent-host-death family protein
MVREVGVLEAKTHFSALLDSLERGGEEIVITRHGKAVARLSPAHGETPRLRRLSGPELAERFRLLRERLSRENPEIDKVTYEELKEMMHE